MSTSGRCLEEGEVADSDESDNGNAGKMEMTGDRELVDKHFPQLQSTTSYRTVPRNCAGSSSDSSSDDEEQEFNTSPVKAKRGRPNFCSPGDGHSIRPHGEGFLRASEHFQRKQSQDVWGKVALEQTIDDSIRKVNTVEKDSDDDQCDDRGVESYNYKCKAELEVSDARERIDYGEDMFDGIEQEEVEENNLCDIESFGVENNHSSTEPCSVHDGQPHRSRKRTMKDRITQRRTSSSTESSDRKNIKDRLGTRRNHTVHKFSRKATFDFHCNESDDPNDVSAELVKALGEPEYQLELFQRVVNTVGVKKAIELYYITENIEENGGMLVMNGDRRRSPGGVFLQMVKNDSATTKDMIKTMFPFKPKKKKSSSRKQQNKGQRKGVSTSDPDEKVLPSKAEILLDLERRKNAMDLGHAGSDDLDLDQNEVGIEIDFPND